MVISEFNYPYYVFEEEVFLRKTELFKFLAKVVSENDASLWKLKGKPTNHWSDMETDF
jgi:hypothetical protein